MRQKGILLFLFALCYLVPSFFVFAQEEDEVIPVIKFKDADIRVVLQSIAEKATRDGKKVNIVTSPQVEGLVSVRLENVDWQTALDGILGAYNYAYKWIGHNIILVATIEEMKEKETQEKQRQEVEVPHTRVFKLKYLDANDAKKSIEPVLSPVGRVSVLELTGQAGWEFGTDITKRQRYKEGKISRTKMLIVSDVTKKMEEIDNLLKQIDILPKQILIKSRIIEVNKDLLEDIGFDWGTGTTGASTTTYSDQNLDNEGTNTLGGHVLADQVTPSGFGPKSTSITSSNSGLKLTFKHLSGAQFEGILHALEEDVRSNTLSAPTILTLNNQEASILVGEKYPIVKTEVSTETSQITGGSLDYYQDIGIQLNVIPQICGDSEEFINMILHPAVTARKQDVTITDTNGTTLVSYPWLTSREAETQIIIKDGETVVIGGLLKDVKTKSEIGVPLLSHIPLLGWFFRRYTNDIEKIDLLIFVTAKIVSPGANVPQSDEVMPALSSMPEEE